ncbi:MAG: acyloxyacyl hydrolase [Rickettsiales bacterium]|jgi:hypothetical protein|nr:acyloxyacyl hydrolase [Rickettsiales bacterium]
MKKFILFLMSLLIMQSASADFHFLKSSDENNLLFGENKNQIALNVGMGVDSGIIVPPPDRPVPFSILHFQYSQPSTFFRLPARMSLNIAQTIGFGKKYDWDWRDFSIPIVFLTEDVILLHGRDWYAGAGAGAGFQMEENEREGSKFLFQFKLFAGYKITKSVAAEFFVLHRSNGNTDPVNNAYAFYVFGFNYSF